MDSVPGFERAAEAENATNREAAPAGGEAPGFIEFKFRANRLHNYVVRKKIPKEAVCPVGDTYTLLSPTKIIRSDLLAPRRNPDGLVKALFDTSDRWTEESGRRVCEKKDAAERDVKRKPAPFAGSHVKSAKTHWNPYEHPGAPLPGEAPGPEITGTLPRMDWELLRKAALLSAETAEKTDQYPMTGERRAHAARMREIAAGIGDFVEAAVVQRQAEAVTHPGQRPGTSGNKSADDESQRRAENRYLIYLRDAENLVERIENALASALPSELSLLSRELRDVLPPALMLLYERRSVDAQRLALLVRLVEVQRRHFANLRAVNRNRRATIESLLSGIAGKISPAWVLAKLPPVDIPLMPADLKSAVAVSPLPAPAPKVIDHLPSIDRVPPGLAAEVVAWFQTAGFVRVPTEQQVRNLAHFIHISAIARANATPWKRPLEVQRLSDGLEILRQAMPACLALADAAEAKHKAAMESNNLPAEWGEGFDRKIQDLRTLARAVEVAAPKFCIAKRPGRPPPAGKATALSAAGLIRSVAQASGNAPPKFTADGPGTKMLSLVLSRIEGAPRNLPQISEMFRPPRPSSQDF